MTKQALKVGDLVRVPRRTGAVWHSVPFGSVCVVIEVENRWGNPQVLTLDGLSQGIPARYLKLAKQATRKLLAYQNRRG